MTEPGSVSVCKAGCILLAEVSTLLGSDSGPGGGGGGAGGGAGGLAAGAAGAVAGLADVPWTAIVKLSVVLSGLTGRSLTGTAPSRYARRLESVLVVTGSSQTAS